MPEIYKQMMILIRKIPSSQPLKKQMHQRNCADLSIFNRHSRMHQAGRAAPTLGGGNVSELTLFLSPLSRASRNVMFCAWSSGSLLWNHRHTDCLRHTAQPAGVHVPRNIHRDILHPHSLCGEGVAKLLSWTPQPNESGKWTFPQKTWTTLLFPCCDIQIWQMEK